MSKYLQLYIKVFLFFSIGTGIGMSIMFSTLYLPFGLHPSTLLSLVQNTISFVWQYSIPSGLLFSLITVSIHIWRVHNLPTHEPENISPIQTRSLILEANQQTTFKACLSSLMLISGKIIEQNEPFLLKVRTPPSMSSWGQEIEFLIKPTKGSRTFVSFTCRPKIKLTLVDFGSSIEVVEKIYWYLEEKLK